MLRMTERVVPPLPESSFVARESFGDASDYNYKDTLSVHASEETDLFGEYLALRQFGSQFGLDQENSLRLHTDSDEVRREQVVIEAASQMLIYPYLGPFLLQFPAFYRLLRSAELRGEWSRTMGDSLFIGSANTVPEVAATYLPTPPEEIVGTIQKLDDLDGYHDVFLDPQAFFEGRGRAVGRFLGEGSVVAVEPHKSSVTVKGLLEDFFLIPSEKTHTLPMTLGEAIATGALPLSVDSIVMNRADPAVFTDSDADDFVSPNESIQYIAMLKLKKDLESVMPHLLSRVSGNGQCVVTVGQGNSEAEWAQRVAFLSILNELLLEYEFSTSLKFMYLNPRDELVYTGLHGSIGALFARKGDFLQTSDSA